MSASAAPAKTAAAHTGPANATPALEAHVTPALEARVNPALEARPNASLPLMLEEARAAYAAARPASATLHDTARQSLAGGNTRSVLFYTPFPTAMTHGRDCRLWDADGREYIDFCGEYSAGLFGHSEPRILAAIRAALEKGLNLTAVGQNEGRLAALIQARFPAMQRLRFTNSGTEANIMALTAARNASRRPGVLAFRGAYHGGVLVFSGGGEAVTLPLPFTLADYNDGPGAAALIRAKADEIGAVIVEPIQGAGGCLPAEPAFLHALRAATAETGAVLILDEVMSSRHAPGGMQQRLGVVPDMVTLGKYMAGGMSFGAFGGRAEIMAQFDGHRPGTLPHGGTFNNNVLSMAAGVVALGEVFGPAEAEALFTRGEALRAALNRVLAGSGMQFTGVGSMLCPHFRPGPIRAGYAATPAEEQLRELYFLDMMEAGLYLARRGMIALSLPIGDAECARLVEATAAFRERRAAVLPGI
ncbi:aminotransferase class III-fold pyridoxal phosphate-dependent enzyme [Roseomonas sp. GC11]|nr:aminotransferase class III-fold pyridoxal phosphate-dependent enzyme [Roseomonas sp. GC11]MCQ4158954.1 aminotransferase class III-fold pyridoxal phosphate-dependent enzyme [Roseomonas sp. GC11]